MIEKWLGILLIIEKTSYKQGVKDSTYEGYNLNNLLLYHFFTSNIEELCTHNVLPSNYKEWEL